MRRIASIGALKTWGKTTYVVDDLFFTSWAQLSEKRMVEVQSLMMQLKSFDLSSVEHGLISIKVLRLIRRNPALVDKINVEQAVDIFNDLKFLREPWFDFAPVAHSRLTTWSGLTTLRTPSDHMADCTFAHFIYADNEFSSFLATNKTEHLTRLFATIYQKDFDEEKVEAIAKRLNLKEWQLMHTFFTYSFVRNFVMERCKALLLSSPHTEGEIEQNTTVVPTGGMWQKLLHRLAETPAFPGMDAASDARMYKALDYLEDLAQNNNTKTHGKS